MTWLFTNLEGSVDTQTVANTGVTERNYRDPYGAPITMAGGAWADGNGYMNKPATASTGLTTVGARTYDPVLGKFLSVDPVIDTSLPQQNTGYTYSENNPTTYRDPSGLKFAFDAPTQLGGTRWPVFTEQQKKDWVRPPNAPVRPYAPPKSAPAKSSKRPATQPLISIKSGWKPPAPEVGVGVQVCALLCLSYEGGVNGSQAFGVSAGVKLEATVTVGTTWEDEPGFFVTGECSATALVGATAQVGVGISDPDGAGGIALNGTAAGGVKIGTGGGCSGGLKWTWR